MPGATDPLELLLVIHSINARGGMEVQLAHLANGLAARGHRVRIASLRTGDDPGERALGPPLDPRVDVRHLGGEGRAARVAVLGPLTRLARASEVVHCTGWDASLWGRLAALAARRPMVVAEHSPGREHQVSSSGAPRGTWIGAHNRVLDRPTTVTVMCADWQRAMLEAEGVAPGKLITIPNGVPVEELGRRAADGPTREDLGLPSGSRVVVHVARFAPQKRQSVTLETVQRLRAALGDVRVVFAGAGPDEDAVRAAAAAMGADWATFLGRHPDVPALFALADLAVLPSTGEALPMVLLEAIAVGTPVVATDVGDVGPLLARTGAGVAVPAADPDAFFAACRRVLEDPEEHRRLAEAAAAARAEIDAATMVERYEGVLRVVRGG